VLLYSVCEEIIGSLDQTGYLRTHPADIGISCNADLAEVKKALRTFADDVNRVSGYSPYGQARDLGTPEDQEPKRWPGTRRVSGYWMMLACNLAQIGIILDDTDLVRLAERQLQWCLGKNVADCSAIHGVGERTFAGGDNKLSSRAFMESYLAGTSKLYTFKGMVPTLAFRNMGNGSLSTNFETGDRQLPPVPRGIPQGYLAYWLQGNTAEPPGPTEAFTCLHTPMVFASASMQEALTYLATKENR